MRKRLFGIAAIFLCAAVMSRGQAPVPIDKDAVARGQQTFASTCGFCHGSGAKGGEKGPDLLRSVLVLEDVGGKNIGPVILQGRVEKGMPRFALAANQITDIAAFLHSAVEGAKDRDSYKILNIVTGDATKGAAYFATHCSGCHSASGDLKAIGKKYDAVKLQEKWIEPDAPNGITVAVTTAAGETVSGVVLNYDDFNVALRDNKGEYRSFRRTASGPKVELHNKLQGHLDLLAGYTDDDIHNLTAYLVTLK